MKAKVDKPEMKMSEEEFFAKAADTHSKVLTALAGGSVLAGAAGAVGALKVAEGALTAATAADAVLTAAKTKSATEAKEGSSAKAKKAAEAKKQALKTVLNAVGGKLTRRLATGVVTRTGANVQNTLFRSAETGRFVSNKLGIGVNASADATAVGISVVPVKEEPNQ
jgi:hypothetical protein